MILPNFSICCRAYLKLSRYRKFSATPQVTFLLTVFFSWYHLIRSTASATFSAAGFSDRTCFPAESADRMNGTWLAIGRLFEKSAHCSFLIQLWSLPDNQCLNIITLQNVLIALWGVFRVQIYFLCYFLRDIFCRFNWSRVYSFQFQVFWG